MSTVRHSAIYEGTVWHHRLEPRRHFFRYRVAMVYLDLDEVDDVFAQSPWWSQEYWNLACFRRSDYHGPAKTDLKQAVLDSIEQSGVPSPDGAVRLLTNLRYCGFIINPISCYYCFDREERLRVLVAEVTNTPWGERCHYVLPVTDPDGRLDCEFPKAMHVSPFMPMDLAYHWKSGLPADTLRLDMALLREGVLQFTAGMNLLRRPCTAASMRALLWRFPFMTLQVAIGIYFQALKLWSKRVRFHPHPQKARNTSGKSTADSVGPT